MKKKESGFLLQSARTGSDAFGTAHYGRNIKVFGRNTRVSKDLESKTQRDLGRSRVPRAQQPRAPCAVDTPAAGGGGRAGENPTRRQRRGSRTGRARRAPSAAQPWWVRQETAPPGHPRRGSPSQPRAQELGDTRGHSRRPSRSRGSPRPRVGAFNVCRCLRVTTPWASRGQQAAMCGVGHARKW